mgnify:FL=1
MLALYLAYLDDANDQRLFEDIYYSYRKQMVTLALSILGKKEDAEDAVSKVFVRIAEKNWDVVRGIKSDTDLRNYLLKATKNTSLNMIKARKKENVSLDTISEYYLEGIEELSDDSFLEVICNRVEAEKVKKTILQMNEKYRDVLYYHFVMGLTVPETAKSLNQTIAATKKQLVRGKKMLLKMLGIEGVETNGNEQE